MVSCLGAVCRVQPLLLSGLGLRKSEDRYPHIRDQRLRPRETTQVQAEGVNPLLPSTAAGVPRAASPTTSAETRPLQSGPAGPSQNLLESVSSPSALPDSTRECAQTPTAPVWKLRGNVGPYPRRPPPRPLDADACPDPRRPLRGGLIPPGRQTHRAPSTPCGGCGLPAGQPPDPRIRWAWRAATVNLSWTPPRCGQMRPNQLCGCR